MLSSEGQVREVLLMSGSGDAELIAAFGDDHTALLMYDTDTVPVQHAPGAECHRVQNGKITRITIIFDRQPFTEARAAAKPG
jgi:hypothetical protein